LNEAKLIEFMAQLQALCSQYGVYCEMTTKNRPRLEYVEAKITAKVVEKA